MRHVFWGAFSFGLPILSVVALTNAGTLVSYLEARRALLAAGAAAAPGTTLNRS